MRTWRVGRALYPQYSIKISYSYLSQADLTTMMAFFKSRRGRLDSFLFDDRDDRQITTPQNIGTGNGVNKGFQLVRNLGGFVEPVCGPTNGAPLVWVNGVPTAAYTLDDYGLLTLTTAPLAGQLVGWQGSYYWRVHFAKDDQQYDEFMRQFWELKTLELETVKP
jgi:uncharacterized protein (TIGR02217 family)